MSQRLSELSTILAALRYYQAQGLGEPCNRPEDIHELATCGDECISLDAAGIDSLCEALNCGGYLSPEVAKAYVAALKAITEVEIGAGPEADSEALNTVLGIAGKALGYAGYGDQDDAQGAPFEVSIDGPPDDD